MGQVNQYKPQTVSHPGETLKEKLEELEMGTKEFSVRAGKPEKTIIAITKGQSAITEDMAVQFEKVLKIPARFWLKRQSSYNESIARLKRKKEEITNAKDWFKQIPYNAMAKLGWIEKDNTPEAKTENLFDFFEVATVSAFENYYFNQSLQVQFRISLKHTSAPYAIAAWLKQGEHQADEIDAPDYDKKKFKENLKHIKTIMANHEDNFFEELQALCLEAGVKVVYTPNLPKAPISGATRWIKGTPLIQLSCRYKRNDSFWFTFFHEAGHILLHGKKFISIENIDYDQKDEEKEKEADDFAVKWTFSEAEEREFLAYGSGKFKHDNIRAYAKKINTHPAMIVGRMIHRKKLAHHFGKKAFFKKVDLSQKIEHQQQEQQEV